jgi:hypothetical protein
MKIFEITAKQIIDLHNALLYGLHGRQPEKAFALLEPISHALLKQLDDYRDSLNEDNERLGKLNGIRVTRWSVEDCNVLHDSVIPTGGEVISPYTGKRQKTAGPHWVDTWRAIDLLAQAEDWGDHIFIERVDSDGRISLGS